MPIIGLKAIATVVALATLTGQELDTPLQIQPSPVQISAKPSPIITRTNRPKTPKLSRIRSQKPLRTKLSQNR